MSKPSVVFFGTSRFGLPALEWLWESSDLKAVVTTPDKPAGRKQELAPSPVKTWLSDKNIPLLQPVKLKDTHFQGQLKSLNAEVGVLASYGKIVPQEILDLFPKGVLNLHPSLLPKYRGATPVQSAILAGESITGVTLMLMDAQLDHGPILAQAKFSIEPDDTYESLHNKLAQKSANLLEDNFENYLNGKITPIEQDHGGATVTKLLSREDGKIDWSKSAQHLERMVRAFHPWPGTYTGIKNQDSTMKIFKTRIEDTLKLEQGEVVIKENRLFVGTGNTALEILELQMSGGKRVTASEFLRGHREILAFS